MNHRYFQIRTSFAPMLLAMVLLGLSTGTDAAKLYKWVDEEGNVRYSDRLPPKQAQKGHETLNTQGIVVKKTAAAKSEEELAAAQKTQEELEAKLAAEKKIKEERDRSDLVLLLTFSSEEEMDRVRDNRLDVLESVIKLIKKSITITDEKLANLENIAKKQYTSKGQEIPGGLAQNIEFFTRKKGIREQQLKLKETEKRKIIQQYEVDLARYRFLKETQ
jgi:hypothetical protein